MITTNQIFTAITIAANESFESVPIKLPASSMEGFFALGIELTGSGTATFEYETSDYGNEFVTHSDAADKIVTGFTVTSGPGSDGKDRISFEPELCSYLKIKCTETGGASTITITVTLTVQ